MTVKNKKILFVCTHGIGDLIMASPVARKMAKSGYDVLFLLKGHTEHEVASFILNDVNFISHNMQKKYKFSFFNFLHILRWIWRQRPYYSFAQYGLSSPKFAILSFLGGVPCRVGWKGKLSWLNGTSFTPQEKHKTLENAKYLDFLDIKYNPEQLKCSREDGKIDEDQNLVILGPGSGELESHKRWPDDKYAQLAQILVKRLGVRIEILGGPSEISLCESIARNSDSNFVSSLAGKLSINSTFEHLKSARLVVTNCNGISHMASAVGTPVVGLYGPTNPRITGPFAENLNIVSEKMDCSPCYRRGYITGCGNPICMDSISVERVYSVIEGIVRKDTYF